MSFPLPIIIVSKIQNSFQIFFKTLNICTYFAVNCSNNNISINMLQRKIWYKKLMILPSYTTVLEDEHTIQFSFNDWKKFFFSYFFLENESLSRIWEKNISIQHIESSFEVFNQFCIINTWISILNYRNIQSSEGKIVTFILI